MRHPFNSVLQSTLHDQQGDVSCIRMPSEDCIDVLKETEEYLGLENTPKHSPVSNAFPVTLTIFVTISGTSSFGGLSSNPHFRLGAIRSSTKRRMTTLTSFLKLNCPKL